MDKPFNNFNSRSLKLSKNEMVLKLGSYLEKIFDKFEKLEWFEYICI